MERGNMCSDVKAKVTSGDPTRAIVPIQSTGAEQPVVAVKSPNRDGAKGLHRPSWKHWSTMKVGGADESSKTVCITVWMIRAG